MNFTLSRMLFRIFSISPKVRNSDFWVGNCHLLGVFLHIAVYNKVLDESDHCRHGVDQVIILASWLAVIDLLLRFLHAHVVVVREVAKIDFDEAPKFEDEVGLIAKFSTKDLLIVHKLIAAS